MQDAKVSNSVRASLMTLHKSKGLEFDHVFICGGEENLLPSPGALDDVNLFYVGAKGATKTLSVTWCRNRLDPSQSRQSMIRSRLGRGLADLTRDRCTVLSIAVSTA
jgi:superfamily I DNA/RNA helicase